MANVKTDGIARPGPPLLPSTSPGGNLIHRGGGGSFCASTLLLFMPLSRSAGAKVKHDAAEPTLVRMSSATAEAAAKGKEKWRTGNYGHENNKRRNDFGNFCPGGPGQIDKFNNDNGNSGSSNLDQMKLPSSSSRQPLNLLLPGIRLSS